MQIQQQAQDFIKMHRQLNEIHDNDREKARSVIKNLYQDKNMIRNNPYFCKVPKQEQTLNLPSKILFNMAQVSERDIVQIGGDVNDDQMQDILNNKRKTDKLRLSPQKVKIHQQLLHDETVEKIREKLKQIRSLKQLKIQKQYQEQKIANLNLINDTIETEKTKIQLENLQNLKLQTFNPAQTLSNFQSKQLFGRVGNIVDDLSENLKFEISDNNSKETGNQQFQSIDKIDKIQSHRSINPVSQFNSRNAIHNQTLRLPIQNLKNQTLEGFQKGGQSIEEGTNNSFQSEKIEKLQQKLKGRQSLLIRETIYLGDDKHEKKLMGIAGTDQNSKIVNSIYKMYTNRIRKNNESDNCNLTIAQIQRKQKLSNLSQEVQEQSVSNLKRLFKNKVDEYTILDKLGSMKDFNHNTIFREVDRYGQQVKKDNIQINQNQFQRQNNIKKEKKYQSQKRIITKENLIDKDVYIATKELKPIIRNFQRKFRVKQSEIYPFNFELNQQIEDQKKLEHQLSMYDTQFTGILGKYENIEQNEIQSAMMKTNKTRSPNPFDSENPYQIKAHQRKSSMPLYNEKSDFLSQRKFPQKSVKKSGRIFMEANNFTDSIYSQTIQYQIQDNLDSDRQLLKNFSNLLQTQDELLLDVNNQIGFYKQEKALKDIEQEHRKKFKIAESKTQLEELDYSILERYQDIFEQKALVWQENEIKKIDPKFQRLNYEAIKISKYKSMSRQKV
eukprot:403352002